METQKISNRQSNLEKNIKASGIMLASDYITKLQSSTQYGACTKTDTQINGSEQRAWNKPINFLSINLQQRWEEYTMGKNLFNNRCQEYQIARCKRIKLEHFLTAHRKTTSKWIKGLNIRLELTKFLE